MDKRNDFNRLSSNANIDFNFAGDFIWKSPKFLSQELKSEAIKSKEYYKNKPELAKIRFSLEVATISKVFTFHIATGNLFCTTSLFESYILRFALMMEKYTGKKLEEMKGQGINRIFRYLRYSGLQINNIKLWLQIDAALKIRNCLVHAHGILAWIRNENDLRRIIKGKIYLEKGSRKIDRTEADFKDDLIIVPSDLGDQIRISNNYAWTANYYYRNYFIDLCQAAKKFVVSN